ARAKAGMPGLSVAPVLSGAQVMTVIGASPEAPVAPGTTPQPATSAAHSASAPVAGAPALTRRGRRRERTLLRRGRLPVMAPHDSLTPPTRRCRLVDVR